MRGYFGACTGTFGRAVCAGTFGCTQVFLGMQDILMRHDDDDNDDNGGDNDGNDNGDNNCDDYGDDDDGDLLQYLAPIFFGNVLKLNGVGPVDNRPSND